jgi:hypothetical protein
VGYQGDAKKPSSILLVHHGLHLDIRIDPQSPIGRTDAAGVSDVVLESALSTILDLEDSVACVDARTRCWATTTGSAFSRATLTENVSKGGKTFTRGLNPDRVYTACQRQCRGHAARPLADVRAQCRPSDDQSGHPVPGLGWRHARDPRRYPGRGGDHHDRAARPARAWRRTGWKRHPQLAQGFGLHRQAQDARTRPKWPSPASCSAASRNCWA